MSISYLVGVSMAGPSWQEFDSVIGRSGPIDQNKSLAQ